MTQQNTPEWQSQRKGRVTGSVAGAILGVAPYMTREQVLRMMVRQYHNAPSEFVTNPAIEWGNANEETAKRLFEFESGLSVIDTGFHTYEDWLGASPDGLIGDKHVFEVKCPFGIRKQGVFKTLREQPHYYAQVQLEMLCAGRKKAWFAQWTPWGQYKEEVKQDQNWLDTALPELRQFYAFYLSEMDNPEHLAPIRVEINTKEAQHLIAEYDEMREAKDRAEERIKEIMERFRELSNGKDALIDGRKFTRVEKEGAVSYAKAIKEIMPAADLEPYRGKPTEYWKLT